MHGASLWDEQRQLALVGSRGSISIPISTGSVHVIKGRGRTTRGRDRRSYNAAFKTCLYLYSTSTSRGSTSHFDTIEQILCTEAVEIGVEIEPQEPLFIP